MSAQISLEPVDAANVTVLVDNFVDALLPSGEVAQRPQRVAREVRGMHLLGRTVNRAWIWRILLSPGPPGP